MPRRLSQCSNVDDLRDLARRRLPGPIFHYIDGAADDEVTYRRNTRAFEDYDLCPMCWPVSPILTCRSR